MKSFYFTEINSPKQKQKKKKSQPAKRKLINESEERDDSEEEDEIGEPIRLINKTNEPELIEHIEPSMSKQKRKKGKMHQKIQAAKPKLIYDSKETNETEKDVTEEVNTDVIEPVLSEPIEQIAINNQDQQGATERDDQDMPIIKAPAKRKRRNNKKIDQRTLSNDHIDQDVSQAVQNVSIYINLIINREHREQKLTYFQM
ncbi:ABC transporter F family member 4-like [Mytilus trossulus]|uniref:ABC transporter F family member 4-like n=1 Tax=Mytilus trossulus TaxID=6551 RepID=UPI0030061EE4